MLYKETQEKKQDMWLKPGFKVYDRPLINGTKEKKYTSFSLYKSDSLTYS